MTHPTLKLPSFESRIKTENGEEFIFDPIRKKYLLLTPEEWVRQHFVQLLVNHLHYPAGLIQLERQHNYFKSQKRSDILILDKNGEPHLLVECKSYKVKIDKKTLNQIAVYNKMLKAKYVAISNGLTHFVWKFENEAYVQLTEFPVYTD